MRFFYPDQTIAVSLTGSECALNCAHCGREYLRKMNMPENALSELNTTKYKSCLVSGGCNESGKVPIAQNKQFLSQLKDKGVRLNIHTGLMDDKELKAIIPFIDVISFDFIADDETINNVYHLNKTGDDFINSLNSIKKCATVVPHLTIGLYGGMIKGEFEALDIMKDIGIDTLIFLIFVPTPNTLYAAKMPPPLNKVKDILTYGRELFSDAIIYLGCMRPWGKYRVEIDKFAIESGLDGIVKPHKEALKSAEKTGGKIEIIKECCALWT